MLPLYSGNNAPHSLPLEGHPGLWYDKFINNWEIDMGVWKLPADKNLSGKPPDDKKLSGKSRWIRTVTGGNNPRALGNKEELESYGLRIEHLVHNYSGLTNVFTTEGRFVTGLGRTHPIGNGFSWHPTLGTPYLPGSSIKGMVRAWGKHWVEEADIKNTLDRIFGGDKGSGSLVFLDAVPISPVFIEEDIMTPHYAPYYQGENEPPGDWYSPTPIPFMAMASNQSFLFAIMPRPNVGLEEDLLKAMGWLSEALEWLGAGAKTAVGYGRFIKRPEEAKLWENVVSRELDSEQRQRMEVERQAKLAQLSPIQREMEEDGFGSNVDQFMKAMGETWLKRMDDKSTTAADRLEIAANLVKWYQLYKSDQWKKPSPKNADKIKRIRVGLLGG